MATFNDKDEASITIEELHDILEMRDLTMNEDSTGEIRVASEFALVYDPTTEQKAAVLEHIVARVNAINSELAQLGSLFHDFFDGEYC